MSNKLLDEHLFYEVYENESNSKNPPIILLHGLLGMGKNLGGISRHLSSKNKVICMDFPNHGKSYHSNDMSLDFLTNSLLSLINHLKIEKLNLMGHSLGGKVAMLFSLKNPDRVNKLVVADMAPVSYPTQLSVMFDVLSSFDLTQFNTRREISIGLSQYIDDDQVIQLLIQNIFKSNDVFTWRFNLDSIKNHYKDLCRGLSIPDDGYQFTNPMLLIYGKKSNYWHPKYEHNLKQLFPQAAIFGIEDAGHWLHIDHPDLFNDQVSSFIDNKSQ